MEFEYQVKYSKRKTLNITVERDRTIVVRAPENTPIEKIERVLNDKRHWLKDKVNHVQKYPLNYSPKEFVSGETLLYLGRNYQLLIEDNDFDGIRFNQRFIISRRNQTAANSLFRKWYKEKALEKIQPIAKRYAACLGVQFSACKISEMKYRWASCTPQNNILFNWRIIKAPQHVLEYLVVHELTHLIENNHTPRFWHIVSVQIPDFQKAKSWLRENGHQLEVDF